MTLQTQQTVLHRNEWNRNDHNRIDLLDQINRNEQKRTWNTIEPDHIASNERNCKKHNRIISHHIAPNRNDQR